ncbi:hypothetical protein [Thermospira aquatica]|nr:hypothetical protein [Thermospira aquatica]
MRISGFMPTFSTVENDREKENRKQGAKKHDDIKTPYQRLLKALM